MFESFPYSHIYMNRKIIISEKLGMPFGTASNRLKKNLLFNFIKQLNLDICYHCSKIIDDIKDLSVEHKVSWENSETPKELFFDLDNIAFSHLSCNCANSGKSHCKTTSYRKKLCDNNHRTKRGPKGFAWCGFCKMFLLKECFSFNKRSRTKTERMCKSCRKIYRNKKALINSFTN